MKGAIQAGAGTGGWPRKTGAGRERMVGGPREVEELNPQTSICTKEQKCN